MKRLCKHIPLKMPARDYSLARGIPYIEANLFAPCDKRTYRHAGKNAQDLKQT